MTEFKCPLQRDNLCVRERESEVVLTGFLRYLLKVIDQRGERPKKGSEEDGSDEIEWVRHTRSLEIISRTEG